jgi:hypothetical protein
MTDDIGRLRDTFVAAWNAAAPNATFDGPTFTPAAQTRNEAKLAAFADVLEDESRRVRRRITGTDASEQRVLGAFATLAVGTLGWPRRCFDQGPADGFRKALRAFPVEARRFDPDLSSTDIYQAARNALTMCCLQSLLGVAVELTPSLLGYSLLYPYTDNLLDDPNLEPASKVAFGRRLGDRLRGRDVAPAGDRESRIFDLVAKIEGQWSRTRHPRVFESLVAIHDAQLRSLALFAGSTRPDAGTLIEIAAEKGGASVLADGYLVAGSLTPQQVECVFGLGVFLQLRDDLEDVHDDWEAGVATVFSARRSDGLDEPTARALAVGDAVLARLGCFDSPQAAPVRDIMSRSLQLTVADAAASFPTLYSEAYLRSLERRSPFRFACVAGHRRRLSRANGSLTGLLERWIDEPTVPPTLPACAAALPFGGALPRAVVR